MREFEIAKHILQIAHIDRQIARNRNKQINDQEHRGVIIDEFFVRVVIDVASRRLTSELLTVYYVVDGSYRYNARLAAMACMASMTCAPLNAVTAPNMFPILAVFR